MTRAVALLVVLLLGAVSARAALAPADLDTVGFTPTPGSRLPTALRFINQHGAVHHLGEFLGRRPTLFLLADYDCKEICGPILAVVAGALAGTGFAAGVDYDILAVGLNPAATAADAARMGAAQLGALADKAELLSGTPEAVAAVERAVGYRATFDAASGRYAHPADILVLTADGRVSRLLPGLALDPATLRLALVEAGEGRIGSLGERLHLLCYGLDPAHGVANRAVGVVLTVGGVLTVASLGLFVVVLVRRAGGEPNTYPIKPSFRGGEAEPGTGEPQPFMPRLPDSGSPLRSGRNEGISLTTSLPPGSHA